MTTLNRCARCEGFVPASTSRCPHCEAALPRWLVRAAAVLGGAAISMTLTACYGGGCAGGRCYEPTYTPPTCDEGVSSAEPGCVPASETEGEEGAQSDSMATDKV